MTKLKTLKDISFPRQGGSCYRAEDLKQVAIKWVKEMGKLRKVTGRTHALQILEAEHKFINFFNITEGDL